MGMIRALWGYRDFIVGSVQREFQLNYQNSALGAAWMIIKPLALIIVYTVVFSQVMATRLPGVGNEFL
jgi:lipopolysaccharide transport system permease protein